MNEDPAHYVALEKKARRATRWWVIGAFVGALVMSTLGWVVVNTNGIASATKAIVASHNTELSDIHHQTTQLTRISHARTEELKEIKGLVKELASDTGDIARFAVTLEGDLASNHGASYKILTQLCSAVPGCVVPPAAPGESP